MTEKQKTFKEYLEEKYQGPYMATDIIIRYDNGDKEGIVLIERKNYPYGLALPGGMAEHMTFGENAIKEACEETGLIVILDNPDKPFCALSEIDQDPRAFIASVTYTGEGSGILKPHEEEDAKSANIYTLQELEDLLKKDVWAFRHHKKILSLYLEYQKQKKQIKKIKNRKTEK